MRISGKITVTFLLTGLLLALLAYVPEKTGINPLWIYLTMPVLAACVGFLTARGFLAPLHKLKQGTEMVKDGNLEYSMVLDSKDEIGSLSKSIQKMVDELNNASQSIDSLNLESYEHKETSKELEKQKEYFRRLFEYSNDAVFIYDFDGNINDVNNKACEMLGYNKKELCSVPFWDLQSEKELERSKSAIKTNAKTGSIRFESVFERKDGSILDVEISSSIVDLRKSIMQSIVSNITERKEIERNLRESEEKFRTFMETASDLMYITDPDSRFTYVNQAMVRTMGYAQEELIGMPFSEILDKDTVEESMEKRKQMIEAGEDIHELVWEKKNRQKVYGEMKAVAIFSENGKFQGIRGIFRDITERKKIEESQRLSQMGRLAADMAHEVNNQIMVVSTRAQIAKMRTEKMEKADPEINKDLDIVLKQCNQIKDIVKRLLMFSKPSKGDFKPADINDAVDFVVQLVQQQFAKNNVKIETDYSMDLPQVEIDEKQMQEVFLNLVRNAYEAMEKGGEIHISTQDDEGMVKIEIQDTGDGISEEDLKKIFDPFFTTKEHGTGLGLSVCYGIVKAHDGDLIFTSVTNKGTTATIQLPPYEPV